MGPNVNTSGNQGMIATNAGKFLFRSSEYLRVQ